MAQTYITKFAKTVSCWDCRESSKKGWEYCLTCKNRKHDKCDWYPITIEGIKCKRCWDCGKTIKCE